MPLFLEPYFEKQRELDNKIKEKFELEDGEWLYERLVMALQVELMECCNSWRGFKFWSENQEPKEDLLEEYVDGLHFVLSIGNMLQMDKVVVANFPSSPAVMEPLAQFAFTAKVASEMHERNAYSLLMMTFLDLGYSLGFTWKQITDAYNVKYEVNIKRQEEGY